MTNAEAIEKIVREYGASAVTQRTVWNRCYRPFLLGGDLRRPIKTITPMMGPIDAGKGYKLYLALNPNDDQDIRIVEGETGAIVEGTSIQDVIDDISTGDEEIIRKQIEWSKEQAEYAQSVSYEEFWGHYTRRKKEK